MPRAIDPADIIRAVEVFGASGRRQIRGVDIGEFMYLDERDVQWVIDAYQRVVNRQRIELFWTNVAIVAILQHYKNVAPAVHMGIFV